MPNSPPNPESQPQNPNLQKRVCDFCSKSIALVYCRADSAKLCFSCDREVHSTNPLFTKHTRFQLCDGCDSSPASIICKTEHSVLCQNCDFDAHSCCPAVHDRRPLDGFIGCPSVAEILDFVGFEGFDFKSLIFGGEREDEGLLCGMEEEEHGFSDFLAWDSPSVFSLDDLIASTDRSHNFQAMVVPPLSEDRNFSCGKHKQEVMYQLCEMAKSEPVVKQDSDRFMRGHTLADEAERNPRAQRLFEDNVHDEINASLQGHEARSNEWQNDAVEAADDIFLPTVLLGNQVEGRMLISDSHLRICGNVTRDTDEWIFHDSIATESLASNPKSALHEFNRADRDSALSRYKEKKRARRYDKCIRYESRKLQAQHRTRIKGRFAKVDHHEKHS